MNTFAALCALLNLVCCALCMLLVHAFFYSVGYEIKSKKVPLAIFLRHPRSYQLCAGFGTGIF